MVVSIAAGFLSFDLFTLLFVYKDKNSLLTQSIFHHLIAISWFLSSIYQGFGAPAITAAAIVAELSSIFLNYKEFFTLETRNSTLGLANNLTFFFLFTILRVMGAPLMVFYVYLDVCYAWHLREYSAKVLSVIGLA